MFCTNCGSKIPDDSVFCIHCGTRVNEVEPVAAVPAEEVPQPVQEEIQWGEPEAVSEPVVQPVTEEIQWSEPETAPEPAAQPPVQEEIQWGEPETQPVPEQRYMPPVKPKKPVKAGPIVAIVLGVVVLLVGAVLGYVMFLSPAAKLKQNLESGDMAAAYEVYRENFRGEDLNDENMALLEAGADQVEIDYMAGAMTCSDAMDKLNTMRKFDMINRKLDKVTENILIHAAETVESQVTAGTMDYQTAMKELDNILAYEVEDVNDSVVQAQINVLTYAAEGMQNRYLNGETDYDTAAEEILSLAEYSVDGVSYVTSNAIQSMQTKRAVEMMLAEAETVLAEGDYASAIWQYTDILNTDPENQTAADGLTAAKDNLRNNAMNAAAECAAGGDYDAAAAVINEALSIMGADDELTAVLSELQTEQINYAIAQANEAVANGDYDGALATLAAMQEKYPSDQQLSDTATKILEQRPVELQDLEVTDALDIWYKDETIRDFFGNSYDGGTFLTYGDFQNTYAYYNLNGEYTRFTGTIIVSTDTRPDRKITYWIYLDDELVQTRDNITIQTKPMKFDIDLTGAKTMKIVMKASGYIDTELYFVNTQVYKAAK